MARGRIFWSVLLRAAVVLGVAFGLWGCAAPAVTVASIAADGVSYAATGKSMSDHALSALSGKDCSTLELLDTGVLCRGGADAPAAHVVDAPPPFAAPAPAAPPPVVDNSAASFLALDSFPDWDTADKAVVYGRAYVPLVVLLAGDISGDEEDGTSYWVIAGRPLAGGDDAGLIERAKKLGFVHAKIVTLCRTTYRPGPCADGSSDVAATTPAPIASSAPPNADAHAADADADAQSLEIKIRAARRLETSVAERVEPAATGAPTRLY
ncbi:MAG TPA: hypothetical protein VFX03_16025 [Thermomicrobiales bacterium]|nr:hypothetical protein [Thermomicrobiales bacterium]